MTTAPRLVTFGCRLNTWESEVMRGHAVDAAGEGEVIVVNTCAVTAEAERQARQAIRRLRRENPEARLVITGCAAQLHPETFTAMPEVDRVLGNREKLRAESWQPTAPRRQVGDIMTTTEVQAPRLTGFEHRHRAFVQVQQGCDHRCTFCIVPFTRGPNRPLAPEAVVAQVQSLVDHGVAEVVLTGVDVASWQVGDQRLGDLVAAVLAAVPGLTRLRLTSLDPAAVDDRLFRLLVEDPRLLPHVHLSVQAGDDLILKRMKRRHDRAAVVALADRLRAARPGLALGADLIAGFPTEDTAAFANTLALVDEAGLTHLHVFPYSPREGTPAARMPVVPVAERRERAARLRTAGDAALQRFQESRQGTTTRVLVEDPRRGHCDHYGRVHWDRDLSPGTVVPVRLGSVTGDGSMTATILAGENTV